MNFYSINRNWRLVDLPGYGYAKVAKSERADFNEAAADYLEHRENLRAVLVLIDSRLEPQPIDLAFVEWLIETGLTFAIVFTKVDKQSSAQTRTRVEHFRTVALAGLDPAPEVFLSSAKTAAGRAELLRFIAARL